MQSLREANSDSAEVEVLWTDLQVSVTSCSNDFKVISEDVLLVFSGLSNDLLLVDT